MDKQHWCIQCGCTPGCGSGRSIRQASCLSDRAATSTCHQTGRTQIKNKRLTHKNTNLRFGLSRNLTEKNACNVQHACVKLGIYVPIKYVVYELYEHVQICVFVCVSDFVCMCVFPRTTIIGKFLLPITRLARLFEERPKPRKEASPNKTTEGSAAVKRRKEERKEEKDARNIIE